MKKYIRTAKSPRYNADRAFSSNPLVRADYARRLKDPAALEVYVYDPDPRVRGAVALNEYLPPECMEMLVDDSTGAYCLSRNKNATPPVLAKLANRDFDSVRIAVALHPNTSIDTLKQLANDRDILISCYARDSLRKRGVEL